MSIRRILAFALVVSAAIALAGCGKSSSTVSPAAVDNTPPAAPSNLVGLFDPNTQQDYLIWTASTSPSVVRYQVWQYSGDPKAGNTGTLIGTTTAAASFLALPKPDQNVVLYYRMRSVDGSNNTSAFSTSIQVQRHGAVVPTDPGQGDPAGNPKTPIVGD